jgi:transposase
MRSPIGAGCASSPTSPTIAPARSSGARRARGQTLHGFFELLGERKHSIRAISIDMAAPYEKAIRQAVPAAEVAIDPFHVIAAAGLALDQVRGQEWNAKGKSRTPDGRWIKQSRLALVKAPKNLTVRQRTALAHIQQTNQSLYRAYLLKEQLRTLYQLEDRALAPTHLDAWIAWARRSQLRPFLRLAQTLRRYRHGILVAIRPGLTNASSLSTSGETL